ncbi:MAG: quinone oxidoreductase family protein [Solirubrobacteraceae bacterium]
MPGTVLAARLHAHGEPLVIEQVELPEPSGDELRVELRFAGVNPIDRYTAAGSVNPEGPLPRTLGGEAAGEIDGRAVLVAGERLGAVRDGVWAQAAVVPETALTEIPDGVDPAAAAAMGIAGLTAVMCVRELAKVTSEDRVLVLGASGGVGSMIVSLAAAAGATVWGQTGSAEKVPAIEEHGAANVLVGDAEQIAPAISELAPTVTFDPLGGPYVAPVVEASARDGRIVSFGVSAGAQTTFNMQLLYRKMLTLMGYGGGTLPADVRRPGLRAALDAVRSGDLKVRVDDVLPLEAVNEAFQRLVDRGVQGKLLLDLR